jgi:hypothetical protein
MPDGVAGMFNIVMPGTTDTGGWEGSVVSEFVSGACAAVMSTMVVG